MCVELSSYTTGRIFHAEWAELQVLSCVKPFSNTLSWAASAAAARDVVG
jgi:hypothetical protein